MHAQSWYRKPGVTTGSHVLPHSQLFETCRKAMLTVHANGADNAKREDVEAILSVCKLLRSFIEELLHAVPPEQLVATLRPALQELHPDTPYEHPLTIVRDVADVVVTLERLCEMRFRSDYSKILEAKIVCSYLAEHDPE